MRRYAIREGMPGTDPRGFFVQHMTTGEKAYIRKEDAFPTAQAAVTEANRKKRASARFRAFLAYKSKNKK